MTAKTVGLTGGIACGKSTVAEFFKALGVPTVDADQVAREVVAKGSDGLSAIVEAFGPAVLAADGSLDRVKMGNLVFGDAKMRAVLNGITHPRIAQASAAKLAALQSSGAPYVFYDAALLVENGLHRGFPALVVVSATPEQQLARLVARNGLSEAEAQARLDAQMPVAEKAAVADFVIENSGTLEATRARVEEVHEALLEKLR